MHNRLFYTLQENIDAVNSQLISAKKNNDVLFRRISKEVFQKSFSKTDSSDTASLCGSLVGITIVSAINKHKGRYKTGSFAKSFNKTNSYANRVTSSDFRIILKFLDNAEFDAVLKLLKHNRQFGFKSCLNLL